MMIILATLITVIIEYDNHIPEIGFKVYVNDVVVKESYSKKIELDIDLRKLSKLEVSAFNATHESDRISVSVGELEAPIRLIVKK